MKGYTMRCFKKSHSKKYAGIVEVEKERHWEYYRLKTKELKNITLFMFLRNYLSSEEFHIRNEILRLDYFSVRSVKVTIPKVAVIQIAVHKNRNKF